MIGRITINRRTQYSEDQILDYFKENMTIRRNGKVIDNNNITNEQNSQKGVTRPYAGHVDQVDPSEFFGKSLNGIVQQIKK